MSEEKKEIFKIKNNYNMKSIAESDAIRIILKKFKIYDEDAEKKLTFKPHQINENNRVQIVPWESEHTQLLQRSGYLVIENDIEELKKRRVPVGTSVDGRQEIKLRFCKSDVVEHKRQIGLIFKGSFLIRMINMRNNGQRLTGLAKIQKKIRENIDDYIEPSRKNDFKYKLCKASARTSLETWVNKFRVF